MPSVQFRLSTVLVSVSIVAALLAFWKLKPQGAFIEIIPFEFVMFLLAIILVTLAVLLRAFRQKP